MSNRKRPPRDPEMPESSSVIEMPQTTTKANEDGSLDQSVYVRREDQSTEEYLAGFTPDHWQWLIGYLYRTSPKIDLKAAGKPTNIAKIAEPIDMEWIKKKFGSGGYRLDLCYIEPGTRKQTRIAQEYFVVQDIAFPPAVPYGDWVTWPENQNWNWGAKPPASEPANPVAQAREHTGLLRDAMDLAKELKGGDGSAAMTDILREELREVRADLREARTQAPVAKDDKFEKLLLEELRESRREARELRMEVLRMQTQAPAAIAPRSDVDQMIETGEKMGKLAETFGFRRGKGGSPAEPQQSKEDMLMALGTKVLETIGPSINMATAYFFQTRARQQQQQQTADNNGVTAMPNQQPSGPIVDATAAAAIPAQPQDRYQAMMAFLTENEKKIRQIAPHLLDKFTSGETGFEFRDWFIDRHGFTTWTEFKNKLGPEGITDVLSQNSFFADMQPREKVIAWFVEVFTDPKEDEHHKPAAGENPTDEPPASTGVMS